MTRVHSPDYGSGISILNPCDRMHLTTRPGFHGRGEICRRTQIMEPSKKNSGEHVAHAVCISRPLTDLFLIASHSRFLSVVDLSTMEREMERESLVGQDNQRDRRDEMCKIHLSNAWSGCRVCLFVLSVVAVVRELRTNRGTSTMDGVVRHATKGADANVSLSDADGRAKGMPGCNHLNLKVFPYGTYCGPLIDGVPDTSNNSDWQGTMWYSGGSQYEGQWKNGKMNGWGQLKASSGDVYSGPFRDGMKDGRFDFTQHRGEKHIVEYKNDKIVPPSSRLRHATKGADANVSLSDADGRAKGMPGCNHLNLKVFPYGTYCGPLIDGVPDTSNNSAWQGTMWYSGGSQYEGQWKNGKMNGWGQLKASSGDVYSGPFRDGMKDGRFDFTQHRGEKHIVEYKNDKIVPPSSRLRHATKGADANVSLSDADGRAKGMPGCNHLNLKVFPYGTYCGPLIDGVPDTSNNSAWQGTMWYSGGSQYEGQWKNGKMNGWGQLKASSGDVYSGPFRDGMKDGRFDFTQHSGEKHIVEYKNDKIVQPSPGPSLFGCIWSILGFIWGIFCFFGKTILDLYVFIGKSILQSFCQWFPCSGIEFFAACCLGCILCLPFCCIICSICARHK